MEDAEHVTIVGEIYGHERHADGTGYEASVSPEQAAAEGAVVKSLNGNSFLLGAPAPGGRGASIASVGLIITIRSSL